MAKISLPESSGFEAWVDSQYELLRGIGDVGAAGAFLARSAFDPDNWPGQTTMPSSAVPFIHELPGEPGATVQIIRRGVRRRIGMVGDGRSLEILGMMSGRAIEIGLKPHDLAGTMQQHPYDTMSPFNREATEIHRNILSGGCINLSKVFETIVSLRPGDVLGVRQDSSPNAVQYQFHARNDSVFFILPIFWGPENGPVWPVTGNEH
jgi:hypothetical protein